MGRKRVPDWWRNTSALEIQEAQAAGVMPEDYRWYLETRRQILGQTTPPMFPPCPAARREGFTIHPVGASYFYNLWHRLGSAPDPIMELDFSTYVLGAAMVPKTLTAFLDELKILDRTRFETLVSKLLGTPTISERERQLATVHFRLAKEKIVEYNL